MHGEYCMGRLQVDVMNSRGWRGSTSRLLVGQGPCPPSWWRDTVGEHLWLSSLCQDTEYAWVPSCHCDKQLYMVVKLPMAKARTYYMPHATCTRPRNPWGWRGACSIKMARSFFLEGGEEIMSWGPPLSSPWGSEMLMLGSRRCTLYGWCVIHARWVDFYVHAW